MSNLQNADFRVMHLTNDRLQTLRPVKVLDIYENNTENFHPDGLFSTDIFGRVGDPIRDRRFSFIETNIKVMHPLIFRNLVKMRQFYGEIIKGNAYAIFDRKINDFVKSDPIDGDTGYNFFLSHWNELVFERNDSKQRGARIDFIEKYRKIALTDKILVLPAGLRDLYPNPNGQDEEGEINEFYRKIISIANTLSTTADVNSRVTDSSRLGIQNAFNSIYTFIIGLCRGKGGFILKKWAKRRVSNGTRAVLTAQNVVTNRISDNDYPGWNHTSIGIGLMLKGLLPVAVHKLSTYQIVMDSFPTNDNTAMLINPKTLVREQVRLDNRTADKWTTQTGLESLFENFMEHSIRAKPVTVNDHYIGLVYRGPNKTFKVISDINDLELYPWMERKYVHPISWVELFYLMGYKDWNTYPMTNTRYPVTGAGSIFPSFVFVKTTSVSEIRYEANDEDGSPIKENRALVYPVLENAIFIDSNAVNPSRLAGLGADFDGDTTSGIALYSEDARRENARYLYTKAAVLAPGGGLLNDPYTDPINRVLLNMSGD